jgi:DTW domain-containing protein YfiP
MNLESFQQRHIEQAKKSIQYREHCQICRQPQVGCYCAHIRPFDPKIKFVILIHPIEERRRIATGRMSHLTLQQSELISGQNFSHQERVNEILNDPTLSPVILYPGKNSIDISLKTPDQTIFQPGKKPVVFVIDGTWATARKMIRLSENLQTLPRIGFTPTRPSQFRVRKQPNQNCYSTLEAIHCCIELLSSQVDFCIETREHDHLLNAFNYMVEKQIKFLNDLFENPKANTYRRRLPQACETGYK